MDHYYRAKVTGKGQTQVPSAVRKLLGANAGDTLVFRVAEGGVVYVTAEPKVTLSDLAGCLKSEVPYVGLEAEHEAWPEAAVERHERVVREYTEQVGSSPDRGKPTHGRTKGRARR